MQRLGTQKKDCWWNESAKSGKDTASLGTLITPAENTKLESSITRVLTQSDEVKLCQPTLHSGCNRERNEDPVVKTS